MRNRFLPKNYISLTRDFGKFAKQQGFDYVDETNSNELAHKIGCIACKVPALGKNTKPYGIYYTIHPQSSKKVIPPYTEIGRYEGPPKKLKEYQPHNGTAYLFETKQLLPGNSKKSTVVIDGTYEGNYTRCLNHSEIGNVIAYAAEDGNIRFITVREVYPGEQLVYDYGQAYKFPEGVCPLSPFDLPYDAEELLEKTNYKRYLQDQSSAPVSIWVTYFFEKIINLSIKQHSKDQQYKIMQALVKQIQEDWQILDFPILNSLPGQSKSQSVTKLKYRFYPVDFICRQWSEELLGEFFSHFIEEPRKRSIAFDRLFRTTDFKLNPFQILLIRFKTISANNPEINESYKHKDIKNIFKELDGCGQIRRDCKNRLANILSQQGKENIWPVVYGLLIKRTIELCKEMMGKQRFSAAVKERFLSEENSSRSSRAYDELGKKMKEVSALIKEEIDKEAREEAHCLSSSSNFIEEKEKDACDQEEGMASDQELNEEIDSQHHPLKEKMEKKEQYNAKRREIKEQYEIKWQDKENKSQKTKTRSWKERENKKLEEMKKDIEKYFAEKRFFDDAQKDVKAFERQGLFSGREFPVAVAKQVMMDFDLFILIEVYAAKYKRISGEKGYGTVGVKKHMYFHESGLLQQLEEFSTWPRKWQKNFNYIVSNVSKIFQLEERGLAQFSAVNSGHKKKRKRNESDDEHLLQATPLSSSSISSINSSSFPPSTMRANSPPATIRLKSKRTNLLSSTARDSNHLEQPSSQEDQMEEEPGLAAATHLTASSNSSSSRFDSFFSWLSFLNPTPAEEIDASDRDLNEEIDSQHHPLKEKVKDKGQYNAKRREIKKQYKIRWQDKENKSQKTKTRSWKERENEKLEEMKKDIEKYFAENHFFDNAQEDAKAFEEQELFSGREFPVAVAKQVIMDFHLFILIEVYVAEYKRISGEEGYGTVGAKKHMHFHESGLLQQLEKFSDWPRKWRKNFNYIVSNVGKIFQLEERGLTQSSAVNSSYKKKRKRNESDDERLFQATPLSSSSISSINSSSFFPRTMRVSGSPATIGLKNKRTNLLSSTTRDSNHLEQPSSQEDQMEEESGLAAAAHLTASSSSSSSRRYGFSSWPSFFNSAPAEEKDKPTMDEDEQNLYDMN